MPIFPASAHQTQEPGDMVSSTTNENGHTSVSGTTNQGSDADSRLASSINEKLLIRRPFPDQSSIFKVPTHLRSLNHAAYTPRMVSIGPLHHGEETPTMVAQKERYLNCLLTHNPHVSLEDLIRLLRGLENKARCYYEDLSTFGYESDKFVKMMLLDGCFILTVFVLEVERDLQHTSDPIYSSYSLRNHVYYDLMLVENQLPFFVLYDLFDFISRNNPKPWTSKSFMELTFSYFRKEVQVDVHPTEVKHLVDYVLKGKNPLGSYEAPHKEYRTHVQLPSATELHACGIKFRSGTSKCFLDIKFTDGELEIPSLNVGDSTERKFRNLIAMEMEQHHKQPPYYVTNYIQVMDHLIDTANDVALLREFGVIHNFLGSDEEAAQVFNNLVNGVVANFNESHYYGLLLDLSLHYKKHWNKWKARLKREYFYNPWGIISFIAAVVLVICTIIQAVFSILAVTK